MRVKSFIKTKLKRIKFLRYTKDVITYPWLIRDFINFKNKAAKLGYTIKLSDINFVGNEKTKTTNFDVHYIYHPAWAARIVKIIDPEKHVDISSTLHFSTQLSAFIETEFFDYRPAYINLSNLVSGEADLCKLHFEDNSIKSLSCMHTIEHIGLGRYGDSLDVDGDKKATSELQRVLAYDGSLLFVVPVGKPVIRFNGHRIYSYEQIINMFNKLELIEFSLIPDNALTEGIINNADPSLVELQQYGCGCFWFKKPVNTL